jgi:hypothetical protein
VGPQITRVANFADFAGHDQDKLVSEVIPRSHVEQAPHMDRHNSSAGRFIRPRQSRCAGEQKKGTKNEWLQISQGTSPSGAMDIFGLEGSRCPFTG